MFKARSLSLARFGGCATLFRSWGYFEAHLRALIWVRILREQSLGGESISLRGHTYLRRLPLGGKLSPKVTDEGAILYPTFPCRRIRLSPGRRSSPAPLGESVAPSSAPVCALGHLPPKGKALGVGIPPLGYPTPSAPPTRPAGHASQSSAGRSRRKRMQSCFDRLRRPKHTSQPPVCPQGARSGCIPQFWEGPPAKQKI